MNIIEWWTRRHARDARQGLLGLGCDVPVRFFDNEGLVMLEEYEMHLTKQRNSLDDSYT